MRLWKWNEIKRKETSLLCAASYKLWLDYFKFTIEGFSFFRFVTWGRIKPNCHLFNGTLNFYHLLSLSHFIQIFKIHFSSYVSLSFATGYRKHETNMKKNMMQQQSQPVYLHRLVTQNWGCTRTLRLLKLHLSDLNYSWHQRRGGSRRTLLMIRPLRYQRIICHTNVIKVISRTEVMS